MNVVQIEAGLMIRTLLK